jgi:hypothetical protein
LCADVHGSGPEDAIIELMYAVGDAARMSGTLNVNSREDEEELRSHLSIAFKLARRLLFASQLRNAGDECDAASVVIEIMGR